MKEVQYNITHKVLNSIVRVETGKLMQEQQPNYAVRNKLGHKVKSLSIFHLGHMFGLQLTLKDAEKIVDGKRLEAQDPKLNLLYNFRNVLEYNRSSVGDENYAIDSNLLMHLNKIVLTDWRETWDVRWRSDEDQPDEKTENWFDLHNEEITAEQVEANVYELCDWYSSNLTRLNPLVLIAVFVFRLIEIAPFAVGNKLTTLAVIDYLLYRFGYTEKTFLAPVRTVDTYEQEFYEAWQIGVKTGDITIWVERFVAAVAKDIQDTKAEVDQFLAEEEKSTNKPFLDLNRRQLKILRYLQTIPTVKREDYCQMMDVSTMTAFRDLNDLVSKKLIKIEGRGRGTKYILATR